MLEQANVSALVTQMNTTYSWVTDQFSHWSVVTALMEGMEWEWGGGGKFTISGLWAGPGQPGGPGFCFPFFPVDSFTSIWCAVCTRLGIWCRTGTVLWRCERHRDLKNRECIPRLSIDTPMQLTHLTLSESALNLKIALWFQHICHLRCWLWRRK